MALQIKASKVMANETNDMIRESVESSVTNTNSNNNINAPKYGTVIPNRVFVGGISAATTESDLVQLFSNYGRVTGTKIIADRAGVSKGYGFVTFETEDEAKRLQKDAENLVLKERRLNIAPAIRKQGFARNSYEAAQSGTASPIPMTANQVIRQNGVTFTFHNGMAFFPQQSMQPQPASPVTAIQNHVEPAPVYATGNPYGGMAQGSTPSAFPFSYVPQGQFFYHAAHYPYQIPIDGCYPMAEGPNGVMMPAHSAGETGGVLIPTQYYITQPSPQTELTYYGPQTQMSQITVPPQEGVTPIIYAAPRNYDPTSSSPIVYSEQNGVENPSSLSNLPNRKEEMDSKRRAICDTPVVSMHKPGNNKDREYSAMSRGRGGRGNGPFKGRKPPTSLPPNDNNNNTNNNQNAEMHKTSCAVTTTVVKARRSSTASHHPYNNNNNNNNNPNNNNNNIPPNLPFRSMYPCNHDPIRNPPPLCPIQVPQFPFYSSAPRQFLTAYSAHPTTRRGFCPRNKYGGRSRAKWYNRDSIEGGVEEGNCVLPNTLTPPITPRSPQGNEATQTDEDVLNSMETLAI
ncbi:boule homolog, RNA binding protein isoform X2 [Rhodnius prolixus]|uniref:boule homolog, RNA binding protein isoform X2 n=1 Tax=Rhodnius prolixus TaxID=13249 RepID=UPI003D1889E9